MPTVHSSGGCYVTGKGSSLLLALTYSDGEWHLSDTGQGLEQEYRMIDVWH